MKFKSVCVHTYYDGDKIPQWATFGLASAKLQRAWADRHGYSFDAHVGRQMPNMVHAWDKIPILIKSIKQSKAEWHMVLDADIFITNLSLNLDKLLKNYDFRKVYTGADWKYPINAGVLLVHRSALPLFTAVLKLKGACPDGLYEQGVIQQFRAGCAEWEHEICPVSHRIFNSYSANASQEFIGTWERGDFLVHFAGWKLNDILDTHGHAYTRFEDTKADDFSEELCKSLEGLRKRVMLTKSRKV